MIGITKRLLIVEDSEMVRNLLRVTFEGQGYSIHCVASGADAVCAARELEPEVVVLDVTLPGSVDGLRACELIKEEAKERSVFVVMVTARGKQADIARGRQAGADAYLVKPFSPRELLEIVHAKASSR